MKISGSADGVQGNAHDADGDAFLDCEDDEQSIADIYHVAASCVAAAAAAAAAVGVHFPRRITESCIPETRRRLHRRTVFLR